MKIPDKDLPSLSVEQETLAQIVAAEVLERTGSDILAFLRFRMQGILLRNPATAIANLEQYIRTKTALMPDANTVPLQYERDRSYPSIFGKTTGGGHRSDMNKDLHS